MVYKNKKGKAVSGKRPKAKVTDDQLMDDQSSAKTVDLGGIYAMVQIGLDIDRQVGDLQEKLAALQKRQTEIWNEEVPDAMLNVGMREFKLEDGTTITIKEEVAASITEQNKPKAFAWLRKNGFDDIIKQQLTADLGRGKDTFFNKLRATLQKHGISYVEKESVHHSTLKAFVKEQLALGVKVPRTEFGIFEYRYAKVIRPR